MGELITRTDIKHMKEEIIRNGGDTPFLDYIDKWYDQSASSRPTSSELSKYMIQRYMAQQPCVDGIDQSYSCRLCHEIPESSFKTEVFSLWRH